jgi:hypothetical protein
VAAKRKNKKLECWCFHGWVCEDHPEIVVLEPVRQRHVICVQSIPSL